MHRRYWLVYTSPWLGSLHCLSDLIPQNPIRFHYHFCSILWKMESTRRLDAALIAVWFTVGLFARIDPLREIIIKWKQSDGGKEEAANEQGLVTEGMTYWSRLTGCCGLINPDGQEEPVRRFSWVARVAQTTSDGREINSSRKSRRQKDWRMLD